MKQTVTRYIVIALILILGMTLTDSAECRGRGGPHSPIISALDTNNDEVITESELDNASAVLLQLDKDGDGILTKDELRPEKPGKGQGRRGKGMRADQDTQNRQRGGGKGHRSSRHSPMFSLLDINADGNLDSDEIQSAASALKKLDTNSDGELTRDELRPRDNSRFEQMTESE
jgi:EF hand